MDKVFEILHRTFDILRYYAISFQRLSQYMQKKLEAENTKMEFCT